MPYESPVGNPQRPKCSLCGSERVVDPKTRLVLCRHCDAGPLRIMLASRGES